ncbi:MAG: ABC transporter permease subunit [Sulfurospirillaceae bacterium]|nr:ABC transporter permease subunit [Sulfurospirillaceae bacterium]
MGTLFRFGLVASAGVTSSLVFSILAFLVYFALPLFDQNLFFNFFTSHWDETHHLYGLLPMILGTLYISSLATLFAFAMSFSIASLIEHFLPPKLSRALEALVVLLCGVPTVLYAFAALFLLVPYINAYLFSGHGLSIFSASLVLSFVVLPTMSIMMLNAFKAISKRYKKGAFCLGASKRQLFFCIVLPQSKEQIIGALVFGFARAVGDTLIALMLAGNALQLPHALFDSARTLTAHIALINANDYESIAFKAIFLCGLILFIFTCSVVLGLNYLKKTQNSTFSLPRYFIHGWMEKIIITMFYCFALIAFVCVALFFGFVLYKGISALSLKLIFDDASIWGVLSFKERVFDGIFNAIIGSFFVVFLAIILALPLGFLTGIYLALFASSKIRSILGFFCEILSSIPSIVIGLFGLSITIFLHKHYMASLYPSLIVSALALAVLIIPYIIKLTDAALTSIPSTMQQIGLNLGATKVQNLFLVQLPYISKELLGGVILAMGRAVEDTAVIMMTGAVAMAGIPSSLLQKYEALPFFIYHISSEYANKEQLNQGFGASIILLTLSLCLFATAIFLQKLIAKRSHIAIY